jgi:glutamyl-tRNA reductase
MSADAAATRCLPLVGTSYSPEFREIEVRPAIASLRRHAEEIRAAELAQANGKLAALSDTDRRAVEAVTARIVNELLRAPTVRVREAAQRPEGALYAAVLRDLFALDEVA